MFIYFINTISIIVVRSEDRPHKIIIEKNIASNSVKYKKIKNKHVENPWIFPWMDIIIIISYVYHTSIKKQSFKKTKVKCRTRSLKGKLLL